MLDGIQNKISEKTKFIISFLDRDLLFPDSALNSTDEIMLSSGSYINYLGNNKINTFIIGDIMNLKLSIVFLKNELEKDLEKYGWKLELVNKR